MNGHCDFHTFETAVDVCDLCYGDLCRSCALPIKGRKDRVCKDCALTVSGVRGNGKPEVRGDRRTVKTRREAYAAAEEPKDFFQFFDADLPPEALVTQLPPPPASKSDRERAAAKQSDTGTADAASREAASDGNGIKRLLGRLKPSEPDRVEPGLATLEAKRDEDGSAAGGHRTSAGNEADAVTQLADIRRRGQHGTPGAASVTGSPDNPTDDGTPSVDDPLETTSMHDPVALPPDGPVAIPSPLLQGFPDSGPETPNVMASGFEELSELTPLDDVILDPPTGPPDRPVERIAPAASGVDGRAEIDHQVVDPLPAGNEARPAPAETSSIGAEHSSPFHEERRRALRPAGEHPSDAEEDEPDGLTRAHRPLGQLDQIHEVSPRLRDLVADMSGQDTKADTTENPFLKRSRVVSEPNAVPDYSTDPFSERQPSGSAPEPNERVARPPVPAPISPTAQASESSVSAEPAVRIPPATPATPAEPAATTSPTPAPPATPAEPAATTPPTPAPKPVAGYSRADRHPLAAFAERDRHPLSAFATPTSSTPTASHLPSIDDVFPAEPQELWTEGEPDRRRAYDDVPPIDDLLPPEGPEPLESSGAPTPLESFQPLDYSEPLDHPEQPEAPEPVKDPTPLDFSEPPEPLESFQPFDYSEPSAPLEPFEPLDHPEPSEPLESFEPLDHPEQPEAFEPAKDPTPLDPSEAPTPLEPIQPLDHSEQPELLESFQPLDFSEQPEPLESFQPLDFSEQPELLESSEPIEHPVPQEEPDGWETLEQWKPLEPNGHSDRWDSPEPNGDADRWDSPEPNGDADRWDSPEPFESPVFEEEPNPETTELPLESTGVNHFLHQPTPDSTEPAVNDDPTPWTVVDELSDNGRSASKQRADIDARGSWIPPALRGMAPDAKDAGQKLPRRR